MAVYQIRFVAGPALVNGLDIGAFIPQLTNVEAGSRADAYMQLYRDLSSQGDVTVASRSGGHPLGFSSEEVEQVLAAGVPFVEDLPKNGFQIEEIHEVT